MVAISSPLPSLEGILVRGRRPAVVQWPQPPFLSCRVDIISVVPLTRVVVLNLSRPLGPPLGQGTSSAWVCFLRPLHFPSVKQGLVERRPLLPGCFTGGL